ncbi:Phosphoribosyl-AMP cyclohydrolase [Candidatus Hodgkinia cicadicola]|uniref:phosphoribosyl-ATP diphosphatase n=2 Tax=Candidatus Hodgkinia cicadicola TaxID=573658 RepID=A0ABX4MH12_9HYPH|nr:Phosphoribosyl-AMP cyclohydrolase [Candidatus Hodgkinia cicadicola]PIM96247.1 Phosphoribosyl-AMP cyclohydrolase [Candidatus Hodgkinia cicadicola]
MDNVFAGGMRSWNCWNLYELIDLVSIKSQIISDQNSWTTKMVVAGPKLILKKIGEEQTELFLALNYETNREVVMESVDLIFHVVLLARRIGLNLNNIMRLIGYVNTKTSTQHPIKRPNLLRVNKPNYGMNYPLLIHNIRRIKQCNVLFDRLNSSILNLFMVVVGLGTNGCRYHDVLNMLFFDVLRNIITLICNRNIKYSEVVNEVINRTR